MCKGEKERIIVRSYWKNWGILENWKNIDYSLYFLRKEQSVGGNVENRRVGRSIEKFRRKYLYIEKYSE